MNLEAAKVTKIGKKWQITSPEGVVEGPFATKGAGEARLTELVALAAAPVVAPEAMSVVERLAAAKLEIAAKKAAKEGEVVATPVLTWMNANPNAGAKAARQPKASRSEAEMAQLLSIIRAGREAQPKLSYGAIGVQLDEAGIAPARAAKWDYAVVAELAHKHGIEVAKSRKVELPAEVAEALAEMAAATVTSTDEEGAAA